MRSPRKSASLTVQWFGSPLYSLAGKNSGIHGEISGVLGDGTPILVRAPRRSNALKWVAVLLTIVVFLYAGFLVWRLAQPEASTGTPEQHRAPQGPKTASDEAATTELRLAFDHRIPNQLGF